MLRRIRELHELAVASFEGGCGVESGVSVAERWGCLSRLWGSGSVRTILVIGGLSSRASMG
jgi:hypothetical protein